MPDNNLTNANEIEYTTNLNGIHKEIRKKKGKPDEQRKDRKKTDIAQKERKIQNTETHNHNTKKGRNQTKGTRIRKSYGIVLFLDSRYRPRLLSNSLQH